MTERPAELAALASHWTLDPDVVFLNHGSFGATPRTVLERQDEWRRRLERQPVQFFVRDLEPALDAAREVVAEFVGASPADLAFVPNATTAVSAVLRSLHLEAGDELLTTDHAYNACGNALRFVAERAGARVIVARVPFPLSAPAEVVSAVLEGVTARTRLALVDHVTSPTGLVWPLEALVGELLSRGIEVLVDGAHAPGMLELSLARLGATYYTGNFHKWCCAPKGAAFLYVASDRRADLRPAVISHGANAPLAGRTRFHREFDWCGTVDPTPWLCVPDALEAMAGLLPGGWPALRAHNRALALYGRDALCRALGCEKPAPDSMIGHLAAVPLPDGSPAPPPSPLYADPLQLALLRAYHLEVPIAPWPCPPKRVVRISAQAYNHPRQYDLLAEALTALLGPALEA
jgi:isopenicillin-N epimerase